MQTEPRDYRALRPVGRKPIGRIERSSEQPGAVGIVLGNVREGAWPVGAALEREGGR